MWLRFNKMPVAIMRLALCVLSSFCFCIVAQVCILYYSLLGTQQKVLQSLVVCLPVLGLRPIYSCVKINALRSTLFLFTDSSQTPVDPKSPVPGPLAFPRVANLMSVRLAQKHPARKSKVERLVLLTLSCVCINKVRAFYSF